MLISTSSEFVALCTEQMALLAQGLGASLSIVYLTPELVETPTQQAKLIPVVVYPETALERGGNRTLLNFNRRLLSAGEEFMNSNTSTAEDATGKNSTAEYVLSGDQIVLPLIHDDMMMGLLVTGREDRAWNEQERSLVERIGKTLAIACIMDRRRAWLATQLHQQQVLQEKQQDLLDNLLHQFRNPLTAVRTFGKLLMKRLRPGDVNREAAASIVTESDRLKELLQKFDEVIDLSAEDIAPRLPSQNEVFVEANVENDRDLLLLLPGIGDKETDCDIAEVLEPLLLSSRAIAQERHLQLITSVPDNLPSVHANPKTLREVLTNIIDNALKYTSAGGKILIEAGIEKANYQGIIISDTGPGIPKQDLEHLGERGYRGVQATSEIPGTGLGLTIAKQLLKQMQGKMEVFSPAISSSIASPDTQGTTFIVWLPKVNQNYQK